MVKGSDLLTWCGQTGKWRSECEFNCLKNGFLDGSRGAVLVTMGHQDFGKIDSELDGGGMVAPQDVVEGLA